MRRIGYDPVITRQSFGMRPVMLRVVCVETPVSFVPSGYRKEPIDVKVEPGMFFCPEYMFFQSYYTGSLSGDFRIYDDCNQAFRDLFMNMFVRYENAW